MNELRQLTEHKRREIIHYIHNSYLNPKTSLPYSLSIIESALKESKMRIDYTKSAESQFTPPKVKDKFTSILPLKMVETLHGKILIPYQSWNTKGVQPYIYNTSKVLKENYDDKGVILEITLTQQLFDAFNTRLTTLTDNNYTFVSMDEAKKISQLKPNHKPNLNLKQRPANQVKNTG